MSNAKVVTYYEHFDESNLSLCREESYDASIARMCIFSILCNSMKHHRHLISNVKIGDNFAIWQIIYSNFSCVSYAQNQMAGLDFSQILMLPDETFSAYLRRWKASLTQLQGTIASGISEQCMVQHLLSGLLGNPHFTHNLDLEHLGTYHDVDALKQYPPQA
jgi:hypothetical protein